MSMRALSHLDRRAIELCYYGCENTPAFERERKGKKVSGVRAYCLFDCMKERGKKKPFRCCSARASPALARFFFFSCVHVYLCFSLRKRSVGMHLAASFQHVLLFFFFADQQMLRREKKSNSLFIFSSSSLSDQFALSWLCLVN